VKVKHNTKVKIDENKATTRKKIQAKKAKKEPIQNLKRQKGLTTKHKSPLSKT
jgi:hypothetical protein